MKLKQLIVAIGGFVIGYSGIAAEITTTIGSGVPGLDYKENGAPVNQIQFKRAGIVFPGQSIDLSVASAFAKDLITHSGLEDPTAAIGALNSLYRQRKFDEIRKLYAPYVSSEGVAESLTDSALNAWADNLSKITQIQPIVLLSDVGNSGAWVFYRAKGADRDVVYVDYLKKIAGLYVPAYSAMDGDVNIQDLFRALLYQVVKGKKVVSFDSSLR